MTPFLLLAALAGAPPERPLTLDDALALARKQNLELVGARARREAAAAGVEVARAALLPQLGGLARYTHNNREVVLSFPGAPTGTLVQRANALEAAVTAQVPLVAPAAYPQLGAAHRASEAADAQAEVTAQTVLFGVAEAFFAAASADELVIARAHAVEVTARTLADAQKRREAGRATSVEVLRADVAHVRARQAELEAADARDRAYRALGTLLQARDFRVVPPAVPSAAQLDAEALAKEALAQRPEGIALERTAAAARARSDAQAWRWAPTLSAFGQLRAFNTQNFAGDQHAWAVGVQLDWALFDGGARDGQRHQADAEAREADAARARQDSVISDEVRSATRALATRRAGLSAAERALDLSQQTLALFRVQYEAGAATQLDLLQAQDGLVGAEVARAAARFELHLAEVALARATGRLR